VAGLVKAWLEGNSRQLVWLAFEDYARTVFGNNHAAWYTEPMRHVAGLVDANKVLGSQVVGFDFGAVFAAHAGLAADSEGAQRISALLDDASVSTFCAKAIAAMTHQVDATCDVVLQLPSPSRLLLILGEDPSNINFDMLDDAASALAELLRDYAGAPVAGLVLAFIDNGIDPGDEAEACEVLQGVAAHYDWFFSLRMETTDLAEGLADLTARLHLFPTIEAEKPDDAGTRIGGGLNRHFWVDGVLPASSGCCLYGDVPIDLAPKLIAERAASLRRNDAD
tara:strand:+ start:38771 stop:39610 length:840 start_codon:yes stop_codon:yes gene_type:complete